MTRPNLEELDRLWEEATPGEWEPKTWYSNDGGFAAVGPHHQMSDTDEHADEPGSPEDVKAMADSRAIVALHNAYPELSAYIRHLEKENAQLRKVAPRKCTRCPNTHTGIEHSTICPACGSFFAPR